MSCAFPWLFHPTNSQNKPGRARRIEKTEVVVSCRSEHGAYSPAQTYSPADMIALQAYGLARGVTIVPEIDTPGHARPFGLPPNLAEITACTDAYWGTSGCCVGKENNRRLFQLSPWLSDSVRGSFSDRHRDTHTENSVLFPPEPPCGQLNPVSDLMYSILGDVLMDVAEAFPWSPYFHLGFDEVNEKCWTSDPHIADYMRKNDLTFQDILETFFDRERALLHDAYNNSKILSKKNASAAAMYWDEVVTSGLHTRLEPGDVVQFWHSTTSLLQQYLRETPPTNTAIISTYTDYYLDCGSGNEFGQHTWCDPYKTWRSIFFSDPLQGVPVDEQHRILGGEAALWTETAGPGSVGAKLFPRATAYGARLWNYNSTTSTDEWVDVEIDLGNKAISMTERGGDNKRPHTHFPLQISPTNHRGRSQMVLVCRVKLSKVGVSESIAWASFVCRRVVRSHRAGVLPARGQSPAVLQ